MEVEKTKGDSSGFWFRFRTGVCGGGGVLRVQTVPPRWRASYRTVLYSSYTQAAGCLVRSGPLSLVVAALATT
jgi:hypothetical protein